MTEVRELFIIESKDGPIVSITFLSSGVGKMSRVLEDDFMPPIIFVSCCHQFS